jgi:hypothetical protein
MEDVEINELERYAKMEGSEIGELCQILIRLWGYRSYFIFANFEKDVISEMLSQLNNFKENTKIVKKEYSSIQTYEELEWF